MSIAFGRILASGSPKNLSIWEKERYRRLERIDAVSMNSLNGEDVLKIADRNFRSQFLGSEFVNIFWLFPDNQMDKRRTDRDENHDS
jgi:hypothetical protein